MIDFIIAIGISVVFIICASWLVFVKKKNATDEMIAKFKLLKEIVFVGLLFTAIIFSLSHWNNIAAIQTSGVLLQLKETQKDVNTKAAGVFAAASTVQNIGKQVNVLADYAEETYLKNLLISQISGVMRDTMAGIGLTGKAIKLVNNYQPNKTKKELTHYLKGHGFLTTEISSTIDKLEEFYHKRKKSVTSKVD